MVHKDYETSEQRPLCFYLEVSLLERATTVDQVEVNRHFPDVLLAKGYDVHYAEYNGDHDYLTWRESLAGGLLALTRRSSPEKQRGGNRTMKTLPANASDEDILSLMQEWVNLLAEEKYDEAYHYFVNEEHNVWNWSPQNLKETIQTYGGYNSDREISIVTSWEEAEGEERARKDINWRDT